MGAVESKPWGATEVRANRNGSTPAPVETFGSSNPNCRAIFDTTPAPAADILQSAESKIDTESTLLKMREGNRRNATRP